MNDRNRYAVLLAGVLLSVGCGTSSTPADEVLGKRPAPLVEPPRISAEFGLDQDAVPEFNPGALLFSVAASNEQGYLLAYQGIPAYAPEDWSRRSRDGAVVAPGFNATVPALTLVRWNAVSGAAAQLASLPGLPADEWFRGARVLDVGNGWLVVYELFKVGVGSFTRYVVRVDRDGSVSAPTTLPGTCRDGLAGFARATVTALFTDTCGNGVLFNFSGQILNAMTIADPGTPPQPICPANGWPQNGTLAFNGIDFFALYACASSKGVGGFSISPTGDVGPYVAIATPAVPYKTATPLSLTGNGAGGLLAVIAQGQSSGPNTAATYVKITESAAHVFSVAQGVLLPGESILNDGKLSDRAATAVTLGNDFAIVRERSNGDIDLVRPGASGAPDTTQPLLAGLPGAPTALVSSVDPFVVGTSFAIAAGARGVRFNASAQALDVPPAALLSYRRGQFEPSVAFDGQTFLAAWTEAARSLPNSSVRPWQIFGHRLSGNGALLGSASFGINPAYEYGGTPRVAANPSSFSSAWGGGDYWLAGAATISSSDPPVVTAYPRPASSAHQFAIATDGTHTVVAWSNASSVTIAQLASAGSWSAAVTVAANANADPWVSAPALAFNSGQYAVLWTVQGGTGERVLYGARVSAGLALLDAQPKELLRFASPEIGANGVPADTGVEVIAVGDQFVVAWADVVSGSERLRVARLSSTLQLLDAGGIALAAQPYPAVDVSTQRVALDWDGTTVWAVWRDGEAGSRRPYASLRGRRFSDALVPVDTESFLISNDLDELSRVTLVHGAGDSSLVGYTRYQATDGSFRARGRFLSSTAFADGLPCSEASQCQNGACVAGRCATGGVGGAAGIGGAAAGIAGAAGTGGTIGVGGNVGTTGGTIGVGGTIETGGTIGVGGFGMGGAIGVGGVGGTTVNIAGDGGIGVSAGSGGIAGTTGIAGTAGTGGSPASGFAGQVVSGGSAGDGSQNAAGTNESSAGSAGHPNDSGAGGELAASTAGSSSGGQAGSGGQAPEPDSCSCRIPGRQSGGKPFPAFAGLLLAVGTALARRRFSLRPRVVRRRRPRTEIGLELSR